MIFWLLLSFWLVVYTVGVIQAWRSRYEWWFRCRNIDVWRQHFKDNVSSGWVHYDGVGH